jgi:preprotein translocase subunit YajC
MFISNAMAASESAATSGSTGSIVMLVIFGLVFYFLLIRPQSKRQKEHKLMLDSMEKGDEIVTNGGLIGKVSKIDENVIVLKINDNNEVMIQRGMIATTLPKGTIKSMKS